MSAHLNTDQIAQIVSVVESAKKTRSPLLDKLAVEAPPNVREETYFFEAGYALAQWYRKRLGLSSDTPVDPEKNLRELEVVISDVKLNSTVDAVAVWGPNRGPCIIVNSDGQHSSSGAGRRATLAHELGHLLLDRNSSLPLAEVLGGRINKFVEKRARAFAAELLLPRKIAADTYAADPDNPERVVTSLIRQYSVSREVVAWQIRNSAVPLTARGRSVLRSYVKQPGSF